MRTARHMGPSSAALVLIVQFLKQLHMQSVCWCAGLLGINAQPGETAVHVSWAPGLAFI